ncbi:LysR family transcriptional regulator [Paeniglutamicibacter gangotriensis]|uniref:LysR family transcriptional regulator n=1 Tax=Paeniglutamicibacter gangotriensis Lz1y TaxID=1276920 RepID=M7NBZ8_9MICC|nr:LysR family transcriptional regulator [Paeniglutamicibacter gangotriensis]EMQ99324.1 LysR family transcriptional regulator [Paeniglutamicibacter gangotriensis Lz1y]
MEVSQLQILRELGDLGSVTAVAHAMYVTPSAVSQQLALLQRNIQVPLTRKEGRNLVLTEAGEVLAAAGASVISSLAAARAAIGDFQESPAAAVSVAGFHSVGQALFAPLLAKLEAHGAPVPRFFDEDVAQQDFPALTARYDLVLAHRMDFSPVWPADKVVVSALAHEPLDIALPAGHRLAAKRTLVPSDLTEERWVVSREGYSPADVLLAISAVSGVAPQIVHRINDYATVATLVAAGEVLGIIPRYTAGAVLGTSVVLRPLEGIANRRRIDLLARPESMQRLSVQLVARAMGEAMAELSTP